MRQALERRRYPISFSLSFPRKYFAILIGSLLVAVGVNAFLIPLRLLDGGMIGIGLIMQYYFNMRPGISILIISIPVFSFVYFYNRTLFYHSLLGFVITSLLIDVCSPLRTWILLPLPLHCMYGGSLIGVGTGIMLGYGVNTGGTDLIAQMIALQSKIPIAVLIFIIDLSILLTGAHIIGFKKTVYSIMTILFVAFFTYHFSNKKVFGA